MYSPLEPSPHFPTKEEDLLRFWKEKGIIGKARSRNAGAKPFVFYDGPPTANAKPALHHAEPSAFKDAACRYKVMQGFEVLRQPGWDTHGLPVEVQVEKALGLSSKKDVLNLVPGDESASIAKFNTACSESVWQYIQDWNRFIDRVARWDDLDSAYATNQTSYIEGVWSVFKQIWDKDLVFKDYKVVPYCPRCGTGLSAAELAMEYQDVKDVSVFVTFPWIDQPNRSFIAWTTTPWTLPGHVALALGADITYVVIRLGERELVLAKDRLEIVEGDYVILEEKLGKDLVGIRYEPLFPGVLDTAEGEKFVSVLADFVTTTDGSGIVHTACMYGEDDFVLGKSLGLARQHTVDLTGAFLPEVTEFSGMNVRDALVPILKSLTEKGKLFKKQTITHSYPHCWRCKTPLIYYAKDSWYIRMSSKREELKKSNAAVEWIPSHIKEGRFGDFIREARDWAVSRERFWGTPLPIWKSETGKVLCIGSLEELRSLAKSPAEIGESFDPHRPHIDNVVLVHDGEEYAHEPYVLDVWFDSGAMPFASGRVANNQFPADFIAEAIDQTRGWFYSLMAISTLLKGESAYKRVICMGHLVDGDGRKMSKSVGNVIEPMGAFAEAGADAVRWFIFTVNAPGDTKAVSIVDVQAAFRRIAVPLWNMLNYLVTYANLAQVDARAVTSAELSAADLTLLDRWALSQQDALVARVTKHLDALDFLRAGREIEEHIVELSTWYLRRSRRRDDKAFFLTLHTLLKRVSLLMAPIAPFMSENIFQQLRSDSDAESVHLAEWPASYAMVNPEIDTAMQNVRAAVELGLAVRAQEKQKTRQPLATAQVVGTPPLEGELLEILKDELNVESVEFVAEVEVGYPSKTEGGVTVALDVTLTPDLQEKGEARELLRQLQNLRKQSGLQPGQMATLLFGPAHHEYLKELLQKYPSILTDGFFQVTDETWQQMGDTDITISGMTVQVSVRA